jgi:carbon-monoxide dehydrogenase large subunit
VTGSPFGRSVARVEDARLLRGEGRFTADLVGEDMLQLHVLRSPHAHAAIRRIDATAASGATGVRGAFVATDLAALGALPCIAQLAGAVEPLVVPARYALARDRVRHVGEPVAFVVADDRERARDAAELIEVDYDPLPAVIGSNAALASGATQIWAEAPGNRAFRVLKGDR